MRFFPLSSLKRWVSRVDFFVMDVDETITLYTLESEEISTILHNMVLERDNSSSIVDESDNVDEPVANITFMDDDETQTHRPELVTESPQHSSDILVSSSSSANIVTEKEKDAGAHDMQSGPSSLIPLSDSKPADPIDDSAANDNRRDNDDVTQTSKNTFKITETEQYVSSSATKVHKVTATTSVQVNFVNTTNAETTGTPTPAVVTRSRSGSMEAKAPPPIIDQHGILHRQNSSPKMILNDNGETVVLSDSNSSSQSSTPAATTDSSLLSSTNQQLETVAERLIEDSSLDESDDDDGNSSGLSDTESEMMPWDIDQFELLTLLSDTNSKVNVQAIDSVFTVVTMAISDIQPSLAFFASIAEKWSTPDALQFMLVDHIATLCSKFVSCINTACKNHSSLLRTRLLPQCEIVKNQCSDLVHLIKNPIFSTKDDTKSKVANKINRVWQATLDLAFLGEQIAIVDQSDTHLRLCREKQHALRRDASTHSDSQDLLDAMVKYTKNLANVVNGELLNRLKEKEIEEFRESVVLLGSMVSELLEQLNMLGGEEGGSQITPSHIQTCTLQELQEFPDELKMIPLLWGVNAIDNLFQLRQKGSIDRSGPKDARFADATIVNNSTLFSTSSSVE
eukprot:TRINITY_DN1667_c0_g1_i3.p1 TRINITY_DN1667_c0_g1~~TRINITY_DN1667_c0_g1_i3.p1  ORF type:complete len:625 (+),score=212.31 TRINITY_DN1667_c0_g1_i3:2047-3921(+)